ncbi:hypothetical protein [Kitasatospora griseola]|uniref:hypothetical protein n=1 Tax=Kitasatospora griseola TaxID=2064 RepID=UPI0037FDC813
MTVDQGRPARRVDQPTLLDVDVSATTCRECGTELQRKSTGRPGEFCGPTCRSRAHRRRGRTGPEKTGESPRRAAYESLATGVVTDAVNLADVLDGGTADPRAALHELRASVAALLSLVEREVAAVRNETPGGTASGPGADRDAEPTAPGGGSPEFRDGNETAPVEVASGPDAFRGGNETSGAPAPAPAPASTRASRSNAHLVTGGDDPLVRAAVTDPVTRYGAPDRIGSLGVAFGPGWELATWTSPVAAGIQLVLHDGTVVGWTERLPDGPWGLGGHATVLNRPGGAHIVTGDLARPRLHRDAGDALDAIYRDALDPTGNAAASAAQPAGSRPQTPARAQTRRPNGPASGVPTASGAASRLPYDLALGRPTGWTPPTERGLGTPDRSYALGSGLVRLTWPDFPGVQSLEQHGRDVGWAEEWDVAAGTWSSLVDGCHVVDAADHQALLSANAADAVKLLCLALERRAAGQLPGTTPGAARTPRRTT